MITALAALWKWWKMFFTSPQKLLSFRRYLNFCLDFLVKYQNSLIRKISLISNFVQILPNISQYLIFGRLESDFNKKHASRELLSFNEKCRTFTKWNSVKETLIIFILTIFKGATKLHFMHYLRMAIILFNTGSVSLLFLPILLENCCFLFLPFLFSLPILCEFDIIFINFITFA